MIDPLKRYSDKRDFAVTSEPKGVRAKPGHALAYVIQKHWASRLHYDFRLELDGVLLSWALPKGPSFDPKEKRMAVHVEDHPVSYGSFEGTIPARQYGAGTVIVWDRGTWEPVGDAAAGMAAGKLVFRLHGEKLAGTWELVRIAKPGDRQDPWMLFKKHDGWARPAADYDVISALPDSVIAHPLGPLEATTQVSLADDLSAAVKAALPATLKPQIASASATPPAARDWLFEIDYAGQRTLMRIARGKARLFDVDGRELSGRLPVLAKELGALGINGSWLDGEVVALDDKGVPDAHLLLQALSSAATDELVCFVFDAPFLEGRDLRQVPLLARKALLQKVLAARPGDHVRFGAHFDVEARKVLQSATAMGLKGVVAKRRDAAYAAGPGDTWLALAAGAAHSGPKVTNPDRVIDASTGLTKLDLVRYYAAIAPWLLPHLAGRPVSLVRAPQGIVGQQFFQKHDEKLSIPGMRELDPDLWPGHGRLLEVPSAEALVNAAQMNVIEFHTWNSGTRAIDKPDRMIFDLDPGDGVHWQQVQEAAVLTRALLQEIGLESWLKTSGGKGLHLVVPLAPRLDYDTVKDFSQAIVAHLARTIPQRFVAKSGGTNRVGRVFVDYLRNGRGQTTATAFSARARPGLGVSMPIGWDQLSAVKSGAQWTIATAREYLSFQTAGSDPWAGYAAAKQNLAKPMKTLGFQ